MKQRLLLTSLYLLFQSFSFAQGTYVKLSTTYSSNFNLQLTSDTSVIFSGDEGFASVVNNQQFLWYKRPTFPGYFYYRDLVKLSDSTYCALGGISGTSSILGTFTIFNKDGIFKSAKSFSSLSYFQTAISIDTNHLLMLGSIDDNGFSLMKLTAAGVPALIKKIKTVFEVQITPDPFVLNKINDNLFLATMSNYGSGGQYDLTTFAVDSSLNVLWGNSSGGNGDEKAACTLDLDGKHYTICQTTSFGAGKYDILIICRDNAGTVLWNKTLGSKQFNDFPLQVSLDKDSSLLISGYINEKNNFIDQGLLLKITQDGDLVWAKTFQPPAGYSGMRIYDTYINRFQNISAVFGVTTLSSSQPQAGFMELKPSGRSVCGGKPLSLIQKSIVLPEKEVITTATVLTPDSTVTTISVSSASATVSTLCANACKTKADMHVPKTHICIGSSIDFVNTSVESDSIRWVLDGIKTGNANTYSPTFNTAGNHTVALIAYGAFCNDTLAVNITVDNFPAASFSYTQQDLEGTFTNLSVGTLTDTWKMGDGTTYTTTNAHHYFSQLGVYTVCLSISNVCGSDTTCQIYKAEDHSNFTLNAHYNFPTSGPNDWATGICQDAAGNLIVAIDDNDHGSAGVSVSVMKLSKEGKLLNQGILFNTELSRGKVFSLREKGYMVLTNIGAMFLLDLKSSWYTDARILDYFVPWFMLESSNKKDMYFGGYTIQGKGCVLKRNEFGNKVWAKDLFYSSYIFGIIELKNGDLLVYGSAINSGAYLARLNGTNGNLIWSKSYTCPSGMTGESIWYDSKSEQIYMSGAFTSSYNGFFIMKADLDGNLIWQKSLGEYDSGSIHCFKNQYDQLFVCYSDDFNLNTICRFDTKGNLQWAKKYKDPSITGSVTAYSFALCHDGGIALAGYSKTFVGSNTSVSVIKTDTAGNNSSCASTLLTLTNFANTIVSNYNGIDSVSDHNGLLRIPNFSYDSTLRYQTTINCTSNACSEWLKYKLIDQSGPQCQFQPLQSASLISNIHWSFGDGGSSDLYSPVHTFPGYGHYNVCLTGTVAGCGNRTYCENINVIATHAEEKEANEHYLNIFPNPYMGSTTIQYTLTKKSRITVQVYNTMGQLIKTVEDGEQPAGNYSYTYSSKKEGSAGLYFLRLTVDGVSVMKRMEEVR